MADQPGPGPGGGAAEPAGAADAVAGAEPAAVAPPASSTAGSFSTAAADTSGKTADDAIAQALADGLHIETNIRPGSAGVRRSESATPTGKSAAQLSDVAALIAQSYAPRVAVYSTADAEEVAREKGFGSMLELLRPFGDGVDGKVIVHDTQGISTAIEDFVVRFVSGRAVDQAAGGRRNVPPCFVARDVDELLGAYLAQDGGTGGGHDELYYRFLRRMLAAPPVAAHETFAHPVAAVVVVSSRAAAPAEAVAAAGGDAGGPPWLARDMLRHVVLVHDDDSGDVAQSQAALERLRRQHGGTCHLVRLRTAPADAGVPAAAAQWLTPGEELEALAASAERALWPADVAALRALVRELVVQGVVPYMERCVSTWNEQVAASRRGLTGKLFSVSRRYFGGNGRAAGATSGNYDLATGAYAAATPEAQMRKLADYALMLHDWRFAHGIYDMLRKDFLNDKAWMYAAAAQEMAAASLILSGLPLTSKARAETLEPLMDSATYSYTSRCSQPTYALRTILVASELLRARGGGAADDAARWLTKALAEKLVAGLSHALVIERVSACYSIRQGSGSRGWGNRRRKSAFWQLVAAREWALLDKTAKARLCLTDAADDVYDNLAWATAPGTLLADLRSATELVSFAPTSRRGSTGAD
ncbi:ER-golgi trafficking TRAPP I complex 85 kDa subunit-domain-containing protein [Dipodascopsis tothii]|uniref:ER-golgi trafficking TRAPP I complex 85 kDa subunit-domain-containing protein n=1 Tax=Dipodascopsis tothii TaxID=44089 RepID=UPI0034D0096C